MPAYKGTKTLGANRSAITSKRLQDRRENYDSVFDKLTRPEQFDESNNRTPAHPKFGKPRDSRSSLKKMAAAEKVMKREGSTSPAGGRAPSLAAKVAKAVGQPAPPVAPKSSLAAKVAKAVGQTPRATPKAPQIIRTTTNMKPTPMGKKR